MHVSIQKILSLRFLPIIDFETVKNFPNLIETMLEQNVPILQVNFKNPMQVQESHILGELNAKYPEMSLGAGFLFSSKDAQELMDKGAQFLVSSILAKELVTLKKKKDLPVIISGFTPTEIHEALAIERDLVQIFPASQLHHKSILSILEYHPNANFLLTGGLTLYSALEFLQQGAKAVGLKGALFLKDSLNDENYSEIGRSLKNFKERVQQLDNNLSIE